MSTKNRERVMEGFTDKNFPRGKECELDNSDVPDHEQMFKWSPHYNEFSRHRTDPDVTEEIVNELLNDSMVNKAEGSDWDNRYLFQKNIDGVEWTLVVADDKESSDTNGIPFPRYTLVTVFSNLHRKNGDRG